MARTSAGPGLVASVPERLLAVATRLFAEKGFEGASVQEIVDAAGVTKGAMYHYFDSKDDLLYEIYHRLLARQTKRLEQIAGGRGTADERVHAAAADVIGISFAHMDELIVFFRSMHMLPRDKRMAVRAQRRRYHERFRALVEEGQGAGLFKRGLPADLVVQFFFGAVHEISTWYHSGGPLSAQEVAGYYVDLLLDGLRA
jgi:AcrR family transcriptional regulator